MKCGTWHLKSVVTRLHRLTVTVSLSLSKNTFASTGELVTQAQVSSLRKHRWACAVAVNGSAVIDTAMSYGRRWFQSLCSQSVADSVTVPTVIFLQTTAERRRPLITMKLYHFLRLDFSSVLSQFTPLTDGQTEFSALDCICIPAVRSPNFRVFKKEKSLKSRF